MKWIEYDYVCNANKGITLHKKVEYNDANLAIAAREACNYAYTITEDDEAYDPTPMPISLGGTGACTASDALAKLGAMPKSGGTMTGAITLNGVVLTEDKDYGSSFPAGSKGRVFFKKVGS